MLEARPLGIPVAVLVIACLYGTVWVALRRMPFGLHLLSVGHAEERARLSGVPVMRVRFIAFAISGLLCGFAATFYVATYRNVATTVGGTLALEAIAAVVLGGTAVTGGACSLLGTALGVLLLRLVQNGLLLVGVPSLWQPVVTGALLLGVLGLEAAQGRLSAGRLRPPAGTLVSALGRRIARAPSLAVLCALWVATVLGLLALDPAAFDPSTVTTVLQFSTLLALVALGQSIVILCGGAGHRPFGRWHHLADLCARHAGRQGRSARCAPAASLPGHRRPARAPSMACWSPACAFCR